MTATNAAIPTLVDLLRSRAKSRPDQVALRFLQNGESETESLTYGQMDRQARAIGAWLRSRGAAGQRILLLHRPGLAYITAFFGCLYAGAAAVPAYPPRNAQMLQTLGAIVADAGAMLALTDDFVLPRLQASPLAGALPIHSSEQIDDAQAEQWEAPDINPGDLAFLQYTSGSTGLPKGVMVTHGSLMHNISATTEVMAVGEADVEVSWLPLHHDLGLITAVFVPLRACYPSVLMPTDAFLERPARWVQAMAKYRASVSGSPNFGYDLAVLKTTPEERAGLDLSAWRVAFNGAEAVRPETLERFTRAYGPAGFDRRAFCCGYGLAEATLIVSVGRTANLPAVSVVDRAELEQNRVAPAKAGAPEAQVLVGCGPVVSDMRVLAVDPRTFVPCAPGQVGELWVTGPSVAAGYWNREEATAQTFRGRLADGQGPFLRTGDLGFVGEDGELYITGRLKELIIIRGRNHYPQDIESTVLRAHPALLPGGTAAFAVTVDGEERLGVACEVAPSFSGDADAVISAVRQAVSSVHELQAHAVLLVPAGALPRTMSGKIQRFACRTGWTTGALPLVASSVLDQAPAAATGAPVTAPDKEAVLAAPVAERAGLVAEGIRALAASVLKVSVTSIALTDRLSSLGLDSLAAVELSHQVEGRYGVSLPMTFLLEGPTLAEAGARVAADMAAQTATDAAADHKEVGDFPLSHGQAAIWFLYRMAPDSAAYNIARASLFPDGIDAGVMRRGLQTLVERHPALRTTFHDGPVQRVAATGEAFLQVEDAAGWSEAELQARLDAESQRPFDLEHGPLMRWHIFQLAGKACILHLNIHHIISDLWTISLLLGELGALYAAELGGDAPALPPLTALYTDHVQEQHQLLAGPEGEKLVAYWKQELAGELPVLNLPTDRPRPAVQSFHGATRSLRLNPATAKQILALGRKHGATPFATLLAAYQVFLHRYTGQEEIVVGSPSAGRAKREHGHVLGYFVNPIAVRADLTGRPSFSALLGRTKERVQGALHHAAYPFPLLADLLKIERDPSRSPIFQTMFVLQRAHRSQDLTALALAERGARWHLGPLAGESLPTIQQAAGCDLTLFMAEVDGTLACSLEYNTDLFDAATADRMLAHFANLLDAIVADPAQAVGELPMLTEAERQQVLVDWNQTAAEYPRTTLLHQLFEEQADRTPNAVAVALEGVSLTYAEVNARANQLARKLRRMGVGPDVLVGVFMERHPLLLVGLLGILKAGGAYLPVDPTYPRDRVSYMLGDAQAPVLLTQSHLLDRLGEHSAMVLALDTDFPAEEETANLAPAGTTPDHMAYIIYTSGSTGRPKGAMIHHRGLVNYLWWALSAYQVAEGAGAPVHSSISFDLTVTSLWLPLLAGRRVELLSEAKGIEALGASLAEQGGFSLVKLTPAHMELIARQLPPAKAAASTRALVIGGEALQPEALAFWREHAPATALINEYGPTETVVGCCVYWVPTDKPITSTVPIGRPIANTQLYILDKYLQPVPVGVHGELYIGGDGVCRGYLNRPDLTEQRFLTTPYGRIYKTGDLARWLPDGTIDFLGRIDEQVKIRGYRIELGEIETALAGCPGVDRATAVVRGDGPNGAKRLVGYVVADPATVTVAALKEQLKRLLPEYMVPSAFVFLPELPLSPNGKVDRKALPAPETAASDDVYTAPSTPAEMALAQIWADLLKAERISVHDNFFELGGDSILSIQVVSRAAQAGWKLTPQQLFQHPTVADLAAVAEPLSESLAVADEGSVTGPVGLTPIQHWFLEGAEAAPHHYNQAVLLDCLKPLQAGLLARALTCLVDHHDALRLRLRRAPNGAWEQFCAEPGEAVDLPVYPLAALEEKAAEVQAGLNLTYGPVLKAALFQGERQRLLLAVHHMAVDGVSWRILLEDLQTVYTQLEAGRAPALPPRTTSYQRWAERLGAWQPDDRTYWLDPRRAEAAAIPVDDARGENTWASARTVTATLSAAETRALLSDVPAAYRTRIDDVLLTALARTLSGWTGRPMVAINLEGHGREPIAPGLDLSRTVGWFTALYPVMLDLSGAGVDDGKALKLVKEQLRAVPGKGLGYGVLRYLQQDAAVKAMPEAAVSFNYLGQLDQAAAGFLTLAPADAAGPTRSPLLPRRHLLEVDAMVTGDQLQMTWTYSANRHQEPTVQALADTLAHNLRVLIAHCLATGMGGCTPSDFPLAGLTQTQLDTALAEVGARPGEVEEVLPLTPLQQTMLRESLASSDPGTYLVQMALDLGGPLDPGAMEQAWQRVVQRHSILRASFAWRAAPAPVQVIRRQVPVRLAQIAGDDLEHYLAEERQRGFALNRAPLLRLALAQTAPDRHTLVFSIHHLLLDGWSNGVILGEVVAAYEALVKGSAPAFAPVRPFREYLQWLAGRDLTEAEAYWRQTLEGLAEPTPLPGAGAPVAADRHAGFPEVEAQVPTDLVSLLQQVGRRQQLTQHTLVQGAWTLLLSAFSGKVDVVFGTTVSGRPAGLPGVESMVGPFFNTLPVRVRVAPEQTGLAFLRDLQRQASELRAYEHAPVPATGLNPLFDSAVVYENYPLGEMAGSLRLLGVRDREQTHYGLTLMAIPAGGELLLKLVYDRQRFDHVFVERLMAHLLLLLRQLTGDLAAPVSRLLIAPSDEAAD